MKSVNPLLFLVFDILLQTTAVVATFLVPATTGLLLLLGAGWQFISYYVLYAWGNKSKYREKYINMALFTLGLVAVGALFIGIGISIIDNVLVVGMVVLGISVLLGAVLYLVYFIITLNSLVIEIEKSIKNRKERHTYKNNLGDWWV